MTTFGDLKVGDTFIIEHVGDAVSDPIYKDCLYLKCLGNRADYGSIYVAANLTFNRIEVWDDDTEVEKVSVKVIEV